MCDGKVGKPKILSSQMLTSQFAAGSGGPLLEIQCMCCGSCETLKFSCTHEGQDFPSPLNTSCQVRSFFVPFSSHPLQPGATERSKSCSGL